MGVNKLQSEKMKHFPNVDALMKISLGLILFTIISTAFVYAETISVNVDGTSYDVEYTADQVIIKSISAEYEPADDYAGLIIEVEVTGDLGILGFVFDRTFFDSTFDGVEDEFFILADGDFANFSETNTPESRILSIELPAGTDEVEIIGSVFGGSAPVEEEPVEETPVEEEPVEETPVEEEPVEETPVEETPKTQCGPGTILKGGECVLDERCGPGTILKGGECVLDSTSQPSSVGIKLNKGMGTELVIAIVAGVVIAGAVAVVVAIGSKVGHQFGEWKN